jgi:hypothetical protein
LSRIRSFKLSHLVGSFLAAAIGRSDFTSGLFAVGKMSHEGVVPIVGWWLQALYGWIRNNHRSGGTFSGFVGVVAAVSMNWGL